MAKKKKNNDNGLAGGDELAKSLASAILLVKELWNGEEQNSKQPKEKLKKYLLLEDKMAKMLYAILKLQHAPATQTGMVLPSATQTELGKILSLSRKQVSLMLKDLVSANYVVVADCKRGGGVGDLAYEIEVKTAISCRDTAAVLLELLRYAKQKHADDQAGHVSKPEGDLKVDRVAFVDFLFGAESGSELWYYDRKDLLGPPHPDQHGNPYSGYYKGKLNELADAGEYIERVSADWVRPRMKITLEIPYLLLVRDQVPLDQLGKLRFDPQAGACGKWVLEPT